MKLKLALAGAMIAQLIKGADPGTSGITIHFAGTVNGKTFACGQSYEGVGTTKSKITPKDFRFYVHNFRLTDEQGKEFPVTLQNDGKWQGGGTALIDFENATGPCANGTPETNDVVTGEVESGHHWRGLRFTLGVPFEVNHQDLTNLPSPLNLTALSWVWNVGHKFMRAEFASTGEPRGFFVHLGSTSCTPDTTKTTIPTSCAQPNRVEVAFDSFDPAHDVVIADLGKLLADTNVDQNTPKTPNGCMSFPGDPDCSGIFAHLGLPYGGAPGGKQNFFEAKAGATQSAQASLH